MFLRSLMVRVLRDEDRIEQTVRRVLPLLETVAADIVCRPLPLRSVAADEVRVFVTARARFVNRDVILIAAGVDRRVELGGCRHRPSTYTTYTRGYLKLSLIAPYLLPSDVVTRTGLNGEFVTI